VRLPENTFGSTCAQLLRVILRPEPGDSGPISAPSTRGQRPIGIVVRWMSSLSPRVSFRAIWSCRSAAYPRAATRLLRTSNTVSGVATGYRACVWVGPRITSNTRYYDDHHKGCVSRRIYPTLPTEHESYWSPHPQPPSTNSTTGYQIAHGSLYRGNMRLYAHHTLFPCVSRYHRPEPAPAQHMLSTYSAYTQHMLSTCQSME